MSKPGRSLTASRKEEELADISTKTAEITAWIQDVLKEKLPKDGLREALVDGVILCKLINIVKPGCVKKYHRRPKMMMMKMENIAFFLSACKSRCSLPPALLFAPTDLQDGDLASMRKVLNVLVLLKQEAGGGPTAEQAAKELAEREAAREAALAAEAEEAQQRGEAVFETQVSESYDPPPVEEPEIEDEEEEDTDAHDPKHSKTTNNATKATSSSSTTHVSDSSENSWYLSGKQSEYVDIQKEVLSEINTVIHSELSIEGKQQLVDILESHLKSLTQKVMSATISELQAIVHEMGLGNALNEVPTTKDRQWYIDYIFKYGRTAK